MSVKVFYDNVAFRLKASRKIILFINKVITGEKKKCGDLNFIFTSDDSLKEINMRFLNHNYFTDVITFNYNEGVMINGEIYISVDTVKINSKHFNVKLNDEILRVMIHGVLHLIGFDDKSEEDKNVMRSKENFWLDKLD